MRLPLATKFLLMIVAVLIVAVASSVIALWSSWRIERVMHEALSESLASLRAAEELEIALLDQRGYASAYMLDDGDRSWLRRLEEVEPAFATWLQQARQTARTPEELRILEALEDVYAAYRVQRNQALSLYESEERDRAKEILLGDVYVSYNRAYELCEAFIIANEQAVNAVLGEARREVQHATVAVTLLVALTTGLTGALLWLFLWRVLFPLRRMLAEVRTFAEEGENPAEGPQDELNAMGAHLQTLMSDMADTRLVLQQSRTQLEQAQKLASVGKLAASVAHEIRNPLTAVKMWLFSLRKAVGGDPAVRSKFDLVSEELARLEGVVQNFLEFSRPPALRLQRVEAPALIEKTLELLERRLAESNVRIEVSLDAPLPPVKADPEQIKQVLINLLWNAVEAEQGAGVVRLSAVAETDAADRAYVVVRVEDTGGGVPEEIKSKIYEPFFTTKDEGAGLGLCIAASIMARHRGRIVLESSTPQGACFAVWIPVDEEAQEE